jgi:hypothetical protein
MSEDMAYHVSGDLTELQKALLGTQTVEQLLQEVALLAARLVPDGMSCGMDDAAQRPAGDRRLQRRAGLAGR